MKNTHQRNYWLPALLGAALIVSPAQADTITVGGEGDTTGSYPDGATAMTVISNQKVVTDPGETYDLSISTFNLSDQSNVVGATVTPFIALFTGTAGQEHDKSKYDVVAVGDPYTGINAGSVSVAFQAAAGTLTTNPGDVVVGGFFGNSNEGVVGWSPATAGDTRIISQDPAQSISVDNDLSEVLDGWSTNDGVNNRIYNYDITLKVPDAVDIINIDHDAAADTTELTWVSEAGELFEIRKSPDLTGWTVVNPGVPAAASPAVTTTALVDTSATETTAFYMVFRIPSPPIFEEDFESGAVGWLPLDNDVGGTTRWEPGPPTMVGPAGAHSGSNCYGTDLDSEYTDDLGGLTGPGIALRSPLINLNGVADATLDFWHVIDTEGDARGFLHFLDASGTLIETAALSPFTGEGLDWDIVSIPLPAAVLANGEMIVEWEFRVPIDTVDNWPGWYIDDVSVK